jgi:ADP-ribose pyrophosphatase YjhB (NUDIX family)
MDPLWLRQARELQAIAQTGLAFAKDAFDIERYESIRRLASQIMAAGSDASAEVIQSLFAGEIGYATPKVDVRGAVFRDDKILLVRERNDNRWSLPGGWADVNQAPSECVVREIAEESGFETRVRKLAAVWDRSKHPHQPPYPYHIYKLFFICDMVGGAAVISHETSAIDFFAEDRLPDLSIGRTLPKQIARMFAHHRQPHLPTEFD